MAQIEVIDLDKCEFEVVGETLTVTTSQRINENTFYLDEATGDLYFNNIMPWDGLYYELKENGDYMRVWGGSDV